ncbi:MAG: PD-(D/E)XK nuclease family protein [Anaerolineaceae bacterium]|nr:PD-(D/E)XK nuclease family protein [Anaerolineaceae bacterium]
MQLAASVKDAIITLPTVPGREETVGAGFRRALDLLRAHSPRPIHIDAPPASLDRRDPSLQELTTRLFTDGPAFTQQLSHLHLLEAPGPEKEALAITRHIKGLLLETDARPEDCLIVARAWSQYAGPLRAAGAEHEVPLAFARGEPLIDQPVMRHLLGLLELSGADFPLQETLDLLRAPCFRVPGLGREQVTTLERIGRKQRVSGGRDAWLSALEASCVEGSENIALALRRFMKAVTPPGDTESKGLWRWLRGLCGLDAEAEPDVYSLDMRSCVAAGPTPVSFAGELAALDAFDSLLKRRARTSEEQVDKARGRQADVDAWLADLREALGRARLEGDRARPGAVTVVEASMATGLEARHVFIPGLSAEIFPRKPGVDPTLLTSEREALARRGADLGPGVGSDEDALFLQLLGLARDSLMLSRPAEVEGKSLFESHVWRELRELCDAQEVETIRKTDFTPTALVASPGEALEALAAFGDVAASQPLRSWLYSKHGELLEHVELAIQVEAGRMASGNKLDHFSGVLSDTRLIEKLATDLGEGKFWSASQLEQIGSGCFRFFASRILELQEMWQPKFGLDERGQGIINHAILEKSYSDLEQSGLAIEFDNLEVALRFLGKSAQVLFDDPPRDLGLVEDSVWKFEQQFVHRRLEAFLRSDFSGQGPLDNRLPGAGRRSRWSERNFGFVRGDLFTIPLPIDGKQENIGLRGKIDRLDEIDGRMLIVDYKRGSGPFSPTNVQMGIDVQMLVYLHVAKMLLERELPKSNLTGGVYLYLRGLRSSRLLRSGEGMFRDAMIEIGRKIASARRGDFRTVPRHPDKDNGRCSHHCVFSQLCRIRVSRGLTMESDQ